MHGYKWPINCTRTRTAFERLDSASSALALEASLHRVDLTTLLEFIGKYIHPPVRPVPCARHQRARFLPSILYGVEPGVRVVIRACAHLSAFRALIL